MQRQVELIGAAWGLGGADPGCAEAPAVLAPLVFARLEACGVPARVGPILKAPAGERRRSFAVSKLCRELAGAVAAARRRGRLACVIGGDHTCAGGTWTGVARTLSADLGLVWIDAHMDSHTPGTSHTGRLHGMPLAWLLGLDDDPLYGLGAGVLKPQHVCLVGVRSYEPEEDERLRKLGVRVVFMDEIRSRGIDAVLDEALDIATAGTSGFGVSIDLDVIEPEEAPHVGTPVTGGVTSAGLARALEDIAGRPGLAAIELVEYSPRLDHEGRTARVAVDLIAALLCGPSQDPQVLAQALDR
ncbi:MAG TPA: arginase [Burkholderiales bacterium]|nr:arginase [Burkholderiales bacterium]